MSGSGVSLYGCGVVAPRLGGSTDGLKPGRPRLERFVDDVWAGRSALAPSGGLAAAFGGGSFLVGEAAFQFEDYRDWIVKVANEKRYTQLQKSAGECVQFALGATIDAISCCEGIEIALRSSPNRVATLIGTGLGDVGSVLQAQQQLDRAAFVWEAFWGRAGAEEALDLGLLPSGLVSPDSCSDEFEAFAAKRALFRYFAAQDPRLQSFLQSYQEIERRPLGGAETSLINQLKSKATDRLSLRKKYGAPIPPWESVSPNVLWNIPNLAAAQVSMLLQTHGLTAGVSGACCTFALALRLGLDEIQSGRADVAIVGATDGNPKAEILAAFQGARVGAYGDHVVQPLTELRGTHLAGGACVWVLCRDSWAKSQGLASMDARVRAAAVTSDGEHVITPSADGPSHAISVAFSEAGLEPADVHSWDLHSTGTPGDVQELEHVKRFASADSVMTARKGFFGHGMAACGGWELTAQIFAPRFEREPGGGGRFLIPPSAIPSMDLAPAVVASGLNFLTDKPGIIAVGKDKSSVHFAKLSMGVGGVSSCVICERWPSL